MVYAVSSDQHCHDWSQFAHVGQDGINSRLKVILSELERSAAILRSRGGNKMFLAGDLFHVRGRIQPSVFNPTFECFRKICAEGVEVYAIPGNHDLEGANATELGNAMQALGEIPGFTVVTKPTRIDDVIMVPWVENVDELRQVILDAAHDEYCDHGTRENLHLILHAPLNGVLTGIPDLGLDPKELDDLGFGLVLCGHYHAHKQMGRTVYSIGATTHQTWNDPGTAAGFLLVGQQSADSVEHFESQAPRFINFDELSDEHEAAGNYIRIREKEISDDEVRKLVTALKAAGAAGIVDHSSRKRDSARPQATIQAGASLEVSVSDYIKASDNLATDKTALSKECLDILAEALNG